MKFLETTKARAIFVYFLYTISTCMLAWFYPPSYYDYDAYAAITFFYIGTYCIITISILITLLLKWVASGKQNV